MDLPDSLADLDDVDEHHDPLSCEAQDAAEPWISAFIERNRDALNESIKQARAEFAAGLGRPFNADEIMKGAMRRLAARRANDSK